MYYTDPARSGFWEPAGDSMHLVREGLGVRARAGARGLTKRARRAIDLCRFADISYTSRTISSYTYSSMRISAGRARLRVNLAWVEA